MITAWKAEIYTDPMTRTSTLHIFRDVGDKVEVLQHEGDHFKKVVVGDGDVLPTPFLVMQSNIMVPFMKAIVDAAASHGIKPESQSSIEGKLQATERHLEDMRMIALKNFR
jgi:hypothetical protein